jgi:hypothetical protein
MEDVGRIIDEIYRKRLEIDRYKCLYVDGLSYPGAYLGSAWWSEKNMGNTEFRNCNLSDSSFRYTDLNNSKFVNCNLSGVVFLHSNMRNVDFYNCNLTGMELTGSVIDGISFFPPADICPPKGSFLGYKKVKGYNGHSRYLFILTLEIPGDAKRMNCPGNRKCRASKAKVLSAEMIGIAEEKFECKHFYSFHNINFTYKLGEVVEPDSFSSDMREVCSNGIHFFMTEQEAKDYSY